MSVPAQHGERERGTIREFTGSGESAATDTSASNPAAQITILMGEGDCQAKGRRRPLV